MTINKQLFIDVLDSVELASTEVDLLSTTTALADSAHPFNTTFINIFENLEDIEAWANAAIEQANQEEQQIVMNNFLSELKVVFEKYSAVLEIGGDATGYGESYGAGETAVGIKLTATLDGISATKEINKAVITSVDLV